jgi:hypothetical protein
MKKTVIFLFLFSLMFAGFDQADAKRLMELKLGQGESIGLTVLSRFSVPVKQRGGP